MATYGDDGKLAGDDDVEKGSIDLPELAGVSSRGPRIQLPDDAVLHEARAPQTGLELRREKTIEDRQLAEALHEPLAEAKAARKADDKMGNVDLTEHGLGFAALAAKFDTALDAKEPAASTGLTDADAATRLARDGPNQLTPPKKKSALRKYFDCLSSLFNVLLVIAGVLEYILLGIDFKDNFPNTYLGGILIAVAFLNAFIEFYQLQKSEAILASFLAMIPPACRVVRGGKLQTVPAAGLVKGDLVLVRMGDKTPADLVLFAATDLKVDNSSLTGESEPQERIALPDGSKHRAVEAENLVSAPGSHQRAPSDARPALQLDARRLWRGLWRRRQDWRPHPHRPDRRAHRRRVGQQVPARG
jgi:sodium/potassium-transporting ATPase subunit alpha